MLAARLRRLVPIVAALAMLACGRTAVPDSAASQAPIQVAVAANFAPAFEAIAARFTELHGTPVVVIAGSTGKLYAQIQNGAPFDVFLAADQERPRLAEAAGLTVAGSRFTYAVGRLALCGPAVDGDDGIATLRRGDFRHLAIGNPRTAPYGLAAEQVLSALGLLDAVRPKLVFGNDVAQAMQFVDSGGAELGLVAWSLVIGKVDTRSWLVPAELHAPLRQDAVLLAHARGRAEVAELLNFLRGPNTRAVLERFGYDGTRE